MTLSIDGNRRHKVRGGGMVKNMLRRSQRCKCCSRVEGRIFYDSGESVVANDQILARRCYWRSNFFL
jgi:hypothetical protein